MNLNLNTLSRDHLYTIFSFCSTPSLGNLAKTSSFLNKNINDFFKQKYPNGEYEALKKKYEIKKNTLKKLEKLDNKPRSFTFKTKLNPHCTYFPEYFCEKRNFFILSDGQMHVINMKKMKVEKIKIFVKASLLFGSTIKQDLYLKNTELAGRTSSHLCLEDNTLKIYAIFHLATRAIHFAIYSLTRNPILFYEEDFVILYKDNKIIIHNTKEGRTNPAFDFPELKLAKCKNDILIASSKNKMLVGIDIKNCKLLFEKKEWCGLLELIENEKFVIQTNISEIKVCESRTGNVLYTLPLTLQKADDWKPPFHFNIDKFIAYTNFGYSHFCVVDIKTGSFKKIETKFNSIFISNNGLIITDHLSAVIYNLSSLKVVSEHSFPGKLGTFVRMKEFQNGLFFVETTDGHRIHGILDVSTGVYRAITLDSITNHPIVHINGNYLVYCDFNKDFSSSKIFGAKKPIRKFKLLVHPLMDETKS